MESQFDALRSEMTSGKPQAVVIASMKRRGLTIVDAIKATRGLFGVSLGEAKELVASNPAYTEVAIASAPLQNEILQAFEGYAKNAAD